jgi:hypothetical protein
MVTMAKRESIPGRADTDSKKGLVFEKILRAWKLVPEMRLGQLIDNALYGGRLGVFQIEDDDFSNALLEYAKDSSGVTVKKAKK